MSPTPRGVSDRETTPGGPAPETPPQVERQPGGIGDVYENVVFEKVVRGDKVEWRISGTDEHKIIFLDPEFPFDPDEGIEYTVEVTKDSNPGVRRGKLFAKVTKEEGAPIQVEFEREHPLPIEIDKERGKIIIVDTEIDYNPEGGPLVPPPEDFDHFTLDTHTLKILRKVATAIELGQPLLLVGETSATKTSAIEYLAMMTNNEVLKLNFNGQTDTSELIGKFVPNDGQVQIEFERMVQNPSTLTEKSRAIVMSAHAEGRELSQNECQIIASEEGIQVAEWRWQDGVIPRAMKEGKWVLLDELTLAEANIRERLNSVLERNPSLLMSENGGVKIGPGGEYEVHPRFWLAAATNPASYSGREPMTPAEKRRWRSFMNVPNPKKGSYTAMLNLITFGEQPEAVVDGEKFKADDGEAKYRRLKEIPNFRVFLESLAAFQVKIEQLARDRTIGKNNKEKYAFTRSSLLSLLSFMENKVLVVREGKERKRVTIADDPAKIIQRALEHVYLDHATNADDRKTINDQLTAANISPAKLQALFAT